MSDEQLVEVAEKLYALTPAEFTPARNEEAKRLKSDGHKELSDRVKVLKKPATAAWVVNMLVRHDAEEVAQMLDLGESLQRAQADLDGDALRELNRQRRKLISVMAQKGRALARDLGVNISSAVVDQVGDTLHAAMIDTDAAAAVRTGLLVEPLSPSGVGSLKLASAIEHTALGQPTKAPASGSATKREAGSARTGLRAVPGPDAEERRREQQRRAREEAAAFVETAEAGLAEARKELEAREKAVSDLQASCLQVNGEIDELRRRIDELEDRLEQLDEESDAARDGRDEAAEEVALAESALKEAQAAARKLAD
jgi:chromosome segregation ATPase